ncbi:MAG: class I SAM-dependent methyltransferase [Chloroflexia bacterium]
MEYAEYKIMYEAEDRHWWYRGLRGTFFSMLRLDRANPKALRILDAGCGTGGNLAALQNAGYDAQGFDFSPVAVEFCRSRGLSKVGLGSITDIPYPNNAFDVVISCDVLNDAGTGDEARALEEIYRVLRPGGRVFLNLPAFSFLKGEHDRATDVARRYTKREIRRKLKRAGFLPVRLSYWNMLLFPAVLAVRLVRHGRHGKGEPRSDITVPPAPINWLLMQLMHIEKVLINVFDLPIGSSLAVVAKRPK